MIAKNYRRFPDALAFQMVLDFACVTIRRIRARHSGSSRVESGDVDHEDFPVGTVVRLPSGKMARVTGYLGGRRTGGGKKDCHQRLVCIYLDPENKRFGSVRVLPKLVVVVESKETA